MKKAVLLVSLIIVLISASLAGVVFHAAGAPPPILSATGQPAMNVAVVGNFWIPANPVSLYLDTVTPVQLLTITKPDFFGTFKVTIPLPAISMGPHMIIAVQGTTQVSANFTPWATAPVDNRVWDVLQSTNTEVGNIEGKLDNSTFGLSAIKTKADDIWTLLTTGGASLGEIKTEVTDIQNKINIALPSIKSDTSDIKTEVTTIESKLDGGHSSLLNGPNGLAAIKTQTNNIWNILTDEDFGLGEIKAEVAQTLTKVTDIQPKVTDIQNKVNGPSGVAAIKTDTGNIWTAVNSGTFGLSAIKTLEDTINTKVTTTNTTVNNINSQVTDPDHGLSAIVNAVPYGLKDIKTEVTDIQSKINDPSIGLGEIKSEIMDITTALTALQAITVNCYNQLMIYLTNHFGP